jgi:peroxiredoxin
MAMKQWVAGILAVAMLGGVAAVMFIGQPSTPTPPDAQASTAASPDDAFSSLYLLPKGSIAPRVEATSAEGGTFELESLLSQGKGAIFVFYQGVFCSVCAHQLEGFQQNYKAIQDLGYEVVAVSADDTEKAMERKGKSGLSFPVIPDASRSIISEYGVANVTRANIAYPTVYVVNKEGKVAYTFADAMMTRLQASELLNTLKTLK